MILRRSFRIAVAVIILAGVALSIASASALCQRPVSFFDILAEIRDGRPLRDPWSGSLSAVGSGGVGLRTAAVNAILAVKQSDYLAFPAHAAAGWALERGGCAPGAVRVQWRKAARHSWADLPALLAANNLRRTADSTADVPALLRQDAARMPWFGENLGRVLRALGPSV